MEELDFNQNPTPDEEAPAAMRAGLIQDYDDEHHQLPKTRADRMISPVEGAAPPEAG